MLRNRTSPRRSHQHRLAAASLLAVALTGLVGVDALPAGASPTVPVDGTAGANGDVLAIVHSPSRLYIGGRFTWVGAHVGTGAAVNETDGRRLAKGARVNGAVRAAVSDTAGGWYIGGDFTKVAGSDRFGLARITSTGTLASWNPAVTGSVRSLAFANGVVYVGGALSSVGGQSRSNLAAVDAATGVTRALNPAVNGPVAALAVASGGNRLYVGGDFSQVAGTAAVDVAAVDTATGAAASLDAGTDGAVRALALAPAADRLYIGGAFSTAGGQPRANVAAVNLPAGGIAVAALATSGPVNALALAPAGDRLYVGGAFSTAGGQPRGNVAALSTTTGAADALNTPAKGPVTSLALSRAIGTVPAGARLYLGGAFTTVGSESRNRAAELGTATGAVEAWNPSTDGDVHTVARSGAQLYVGGGFTYVNGSAHQGLAALDRATGDVIHTFKADTDGEVRALAVSPDGTKVYAGGTFLTVNGTSRKRAVAVDPASGTVLDWNPSTNGTVHALAAGASHVYVGGNFTFAGGRDIGRIASVNPTSGLADPAFAPRPDAGVRALSLTPDGTTLYAGGSFKTVGGASRPGIASVNAGTGSVTAFAPTDGGTVIASALSPDGSRAFFSSTSNRTYAYDPAVANSPVWRLRTGGDVQAIAASATEVYVGGHFTGLPEHKATRVHIASVRMSDGVPTAWNPTVDGSYGTWALSVGTDAVYAGGDFDKVNGAFQPRFARFSGTP
jgi:hypothetical protein